MSYGMSYDDDGTVRGLKPADPEKPYEAPALTLQKVQEEAHPVTESCGYCRGTGTVSWQRRKDRKMYTIMCGDVEVEDVWDDEPYASRRMAQMLAEHRLEYDAARLAIALEPLLPESYQKAVKQLRMHRKNPRTGWTKFEGAVAQILRDIEEGLREQERRREVKQEREKAKKTVEGMSLEGA